MSEISINELVKNVAEADSCCAELREAAEAYLNADAGSKKAAASALIKELEEDVMGIDEVIAFFMSDAAVQHFGKETAESILEELKAHKAEGGKYCNCSACAAGVAVLENKGLL